ncbi:hypothetical protein Acr_00g0068590 [Actinidia rufa]|uniref:Uncharacterized protein n=1 Tax=Actinidia rufa TaxID=165716 RepID=A0A7J0DQQ5_9ERIC|nr:hypothetical protein Acr_00g0068590 [Actinidia rufa]
MGLALSTRVKLKRARPSMEVLSIQQHARDTLSQLRMRKRDKNWARDHMRLRGLWAGLHGQGLDWAARGWGWAARGVCWLLAAQGWVTAGLGCWLHKGGCTRCLLAVGCAGLGDCWTGLLDWAAGCTGVAAQGLCRTGLHGVAAGCTGVAAQGLCRTGLSGQRLRKGGCWAARGGCWLHRGWLLAAQRLGVVAALVAVGFRVWAAVKAE